MKVQHPTFPDVFQDVTNAKPWLKQGWLTVPDETTPPTDEVAPVTPKSRKSKEASDGE
jgi:hypothetical protein